MRKTLAVLAASTLAFAACGDDDETPDTDDTDTTTGDDTDSTEADDDSEDSVPDAIEEQLEQARQQLEAAGLNDEQVDCVIDKSVEMGMEGNATPTFDELQVVFEECDVNLEDLQPES